MEQNDVEREEIRENQVRKRPRKTAGSQTDDDNPSYSCLNMAATIAAINQRLDLALSKFQEIDDLKENLKDLQKENIDLKESLSYARKEIAELKEISKFHKGAIEALDKYMLMVCRKMLKWRGNVLSGSKVTAERTI